MQSSQTYSWESIPTPRSVILERAAMAISQLSDGSINLNQLSKTYRIELFAQVHDSLQFISEWVQPYDPDLFNQQDNQDDLTKAMSVVDTLMAKLIEGDPNNLSNYIETISKDDIEVISKANNVLVDSSRNMYYQQVIIPQGNIRDPILLYYYPDTNKASQLLEAVQKYLKIRTNIIR